MKKISKITFAMLFLFATVGGLAACNKNEITGILVEDGDMPQVVFVQGQDLNLSGGVLTVQRQNGTEEIALDSSDVTVSGYNKDTLGAQTLTITYGGQTTQITVTVVSRVEAVGVTIEYYIGETFDRTQGSLRITADNGTSQDIPLSDEDVSVSGFDSSEAGTVEVTVTYEDYGGTFSVEVFAPENVELHRPNKLSYRSHEESLDLSGGYITFDYGSNRGETIELASDMISGFDLGAATVENRQTPLSQTLTVSFGGEEYQFSISITFSDVSLMQLRATELSSLDWSGDEPATVTEEQGAEATEALQAYFAMSADDKAQITRRQSEIVARAAAVYGLGQWQSAAEDYTPTFSFSANGGIAPQGSDYASVKADYESLQDDSDPLKIWSEFLTELSTELGDRTLYGETTIATYLAGVTAPEDLTDAIAQIGFMLDLYENVSVVPEDWTEDGLSAYADGLEEALVAIEYGLYGYAEYKEMFEAVSNWRTKDDLLDILYSYCYAAGEIERAVSAMQEIHLPQRVEELHSSISLAFDALASFMNFRAYDTTMFRLYYRNCVQLSEELMADEGMEGQVYDLATFDTFLQVSGQPFDAHFSDLLTYLRTHTGTVNIVGIEAPPYGGYYYQTGALYGDEAFDALWNDFLDIVEIVLDDNTYLETSEFGTAVEGLFADFTAMSPSWQYGFLSSLSVLYASGLPALDFASTSIVFTNWITGHYGEVLSEDASSVFVYLMAALESYARSNTDDEGTSDFLTFMEQAQQGYEALGAEDKEVFDEKVGSVYERYVALYERVNSETPVSTDLGDWQVKFDELELQLGYATVAITQIANGVQMYTGLFSAFENAQLIVNDILQNAPSEIVNAYYYEEFVSGETLSMTLEYMFYYVRSIYASCMKGLTLSVGQDTWPFWEVYKTSDMHTFMPETSYLIWTFLLTNSETEAVYDSERVLSIMSDFRAMDNSSKLMFLSIDSSINLYYNALLDFFSQVLTESAQEVANDLITVEVVFVSYQNDSQNAEILAQLQTSMTELTEGYAALTGADKECFDQYLSDMYNYYLELYAQISV